MYPLSQYAATLGNLLVDVDHEVSQCHPTMQDEARKACKAHNRAINLMTAQGRFAADWAASVDANGAPIAYDPGAVGPLVDDIANALKLTTSPYTVADAEQIKDRVQRIHAIDANHPLAKHWKVLAIRCGQADWF